MIIFCVRDLVELVQRPPEVQLMVCPPTPNTYDNDPRPHDDVRGKGMLFLALKSRSVD